MLSGLKATLETEPSLHRERVLGQPFPSGDIPQHHAAAVDTVAAAVERRCRIPAARVLPSGLKAMLQTLPSFTVSGFLGPSFLEAGDIRHQHHTADLAAESRSERLAVGAEGDALNLALAHGERVLGQPFPIHDVPQHYFAPVVTRDPATQSHGKNGTVGAEGDAPNLAFLYDERVFGQPPRTGHVPEHYTALGPP